MKKELRNVLITGATSDMAKPLIEALLKDGVRVYAVSRSELELNFENLSKFNCDLAVEEDINQVFKTFDDIQFDSVVCFQGVAISSPVEKLNTSELQKQLDVSLFSLLNILKNLKGKIKKDGVVVNLSSMASFGLFPFISPYSISKASSDILLNCFEIETGIKTVSVKPGVVRTKFWRYCVNINENNFENFKGEYQTTGEFLKENALKNENKGIYPIEVSKLIYKIIYDKNPKASYLIGKDAVCASIFSKFKGRFLNKIIRKILKKRVELCKK